VNEVFPSRCTLFEDSYPAASRRRAKTALKTSGLGHKLPGEGAAEHGRRSSVTGPPRQMTITLGVADPGACWVVAAVRRAPTHG
jgi:hypothetical protein